MRHINTGGGNYIGGDVVVGGTFYGGSKVTIGDLSGGSIVVNGVVIGGGDVFQPTGPVVTEERTPAGPYSQVVLGGGIDLQVDGGSDRPEIQVTAQSDLQDRIIADVRDGALHLALEGSIASATAPVIHLASSSLKGIVVKGSGDAVIENLNTDRLSATIQGSGNVVASGEVQALNVNIQGSGDFDGFNLTASNAMVTVMGSGDATVQASDSLSATVMGSGDVRYFGSPQSVDKNVMGSGSIRGH